MHLVIMFSKLIGTIIVLVVAISASVITTNASAQEKTGLPLELRYFMSKHEVREHLKALLTYQVDADDPDRIVLMVPDHATKTKTALFLKFHENKLVSITSGKYGLTKTLFNNYMKELYQRLCSGFQL